MDSEIECRLLEIELFLGAGASKFAGYPTSDSLLSELKLPNDDYFKFLISLNDTNDAEEVLQKTESIKNSINSLMEISIESFSKFISYDENKIKQNMSLEDQVRSMRSSINLRELWRSSRKLINNVTTGLDNLFALENLKERKIDECILPLFNYISTSQKVINVYTTNYDFVIQKLRDSYPDDYLYNDGTIKASGNMIGTVKLEEYPTMDDKTTINIFRLHGALDWYENNGNIFKKNPKGDDSPSAIIPPILGKKIQENTFLIPIFKLFKKKIMGKQNNILIIIGFSFRDLEISTEIKNRIETNQPVIIISPTVHVEVSKNLFYPEKTGLSDSEYIELSNEIQQKYPKLFFIQKKFTLTNIDYIIKRIKNITNKFETNSIQPCANCKTLIPSTYHAPKCPVCNKHLANSVKNGYVID